MDNLAFPYRRGNDNGMAIPVTLNVLWSDDDNVDGLSDADQVHVNRFGKMAPVGRAACHDQEIDVAVRRHGSPSRRPEENDALGVSNFYDPADDVGQHPLWNGLVFRHVYFATSRSLIK